MCEPARVYTAVLGRIVFVRPGRCAAVLFLSDQGSVKPEGARRPAGSLGAAAEALEERKQLRATSVSIRQTDSSCEQGL